MASRDALKDRRGEESLGGKRSQDGWEGCEVAREEIARGGMEE